MFNCLIILLLLTNNILGMQSANEEISGNTIINTIVKKCPLNWVKQEEEQKNNAENAHRCKLLLEELEKKLHTFALKDIINLGHLLSAIDTRELSEGDIKWLTKLDQKIGGVRIRVTFQTLQTSLNMRKQTDSHDAKIESLLPLSDVKD